MGDIQKYSVNISPGIYDFKIALCYIIFRIAFKVLFGIRHCVIWGKFSSYKFETSCVTVYEFLLWLFILPSLYTVYCTIRCIMCYIKTMIVFSSFIFYKDIAEYKD